MKNRRLLCLALSVLIMLGALPALAAGSGSHYIPESALEMTLSASVINSADATLRITFNNKSALTTYYIGSTFSLEEAKDGKWVNVSGYSGYYSSYDYSVAPGKSLTLNLSLAGQNLTSGTLYRICKSVYDSRCKISEMVHAEFVYNETYNNLSGWNTNPGISSKPGQAWTTNVDYRYATEPVNVRTGPGTGYKKIAELAAGEQVRLLGYSGKWSKVLYRGQEAYVFSKYLSAYAPISVPSSPTLPATYLRYVTTNLNLRKGPGTKYDVIATIRKGGAVTCLGTSGKWTKVTCAGYTGYVFTKYLSSTKPAGAIVSGSYYLEGYGWITAPDYADDTGLKTGFIPGYGYYVAGGSSDSGSASSGSGFIWYK